MVKVVEVVLGGFWLGCASRRIVGKPNNRARTNGLRKGSPATVGRLQLATTIEGSQKP